jgi:hypothetical protein
MRRTVRQHHDISAHQLSRRSRSRVLNSGAALDDDLVRDFVCRGLAPNNMPRSTIRAADLELTGYGDDLQEVAQPVDLGHSTARGWRTFHSQKLCHILPIIRR